MKQYLALIVAAAMLAACGGSNNLSGASAGNSVGRAPPVVALAVSAPASASSPPGTAG